MIPPDSVFYPFAETSLRVSVMIVALLVLRPWLRRFIGSQWLCMLWLLVLARLLVPISIESPWSIGRFQAFQSTQQVSGLQVAALVASSSGANDQQWMTRLAVGASQPESSESSGETKTEREISGPNLLFVIWVTGVFVGLAGIAVRLHQTRRFAAQTCPVTDPGLLDVFESIDPTLRSDVELRMTAAVSVPTLAGVRRPQIWVPESWVEKLSSDEMRHVLLHELGHANRRDLLVQRLFLIAQCLHWFNPLVWIAARLAKEDREMACDAWVLDRTDADDCPEYGLTLLKIVKLLRNPVRISPVLIEMATSKKDLTVRVRAIGAFRPVAVWPGVVVISVAVAALVTVTTTAQIVDRGPETASASKKQAPPPVLAIESEKKVEPSGALSSSNAEEFGVELEVTRFEAPMRVWKQLQEKGVAIKLPEGPAKGVGPFALPASPLSPIIADVLTEDARNVQLRTLSEISDLHVCQLKKLFVKDGDACLVSRPGTDGQLREISILPRVAPDDFQIDLDLNPEVSGRSITTSVSIFSGQTLEYCVNETPAGDNPDSWLDSIGMRYFVTAKIVGKRPAQTLPKSDKPSPPQVEISSKFIELTDETLKELQLDALLQTADSKSNPAILEEAQFNELVRAINSKRGADIISAPRVTTKSGQRAVIEIIRELRDPAAWEKDPEKPGAWVVKEWETRNTGVTLEVEPKVNPNGMLAMELKPQVVEALGFVDLETGKPAPGHHRQIIRENGQPTQIDEMLFGKRGTGANSFYERTRSLADFSAYRFVPGHRNNAVFSTRSAQRNVELKPGQSVVVLLKETEDTKPFEAEAPKRPLIAIITAEIINFKSQ